MLVMTLVGNESTLGTLQSVSAIVSAVLLYLLGRFASARHRVLIFSSGLLLFALGGVQRRALFGDGRDRIHAVLVHGAPLMDLGYFPIQLRVIDYVSRKENRNLCTLFSSTNSLSPRPVSSMPGFAASSDDLPVGYLLRSAMRCSSSVSSSSSRSGSPGTSSGRIDRARLGARGTALRSRGQADSPGRDRLRRCRRVQARPVPRVWRPRPYRECCRRGAAPVCLTLKIDRYG